MRWLVWHGDASITAHAGQTKPPQARDVLNEPIRASPLRLEAFGSVVMSRYPSGNRYDCLILHCAERGCC